MNRMALLSQSLEMLRLGNESGLRYFMSTFSESLWYFAYKIVKDRETAEEIVSETFYKLWRERENAQSIDWVRSFLYLVTRNACYDYIGSSYLKIISLQEEEMLDREEERTDILTQIIYIELLEQIVNELEKLPKQQADVFRMSYLEGKGTKEICEELCTTTNNVYFAKSKALSTLMAVFKEKEISPYLCLLPLLYIDCEILFLT